MTFVMVLLLAVPVLMVAKCEIATALVLLVASFYAIGKFLLKVLEAYEKQYRR